MALIGQTDSRWIVSRRSDGKNVNNWHWTEKDLFTWCQERFETVFKNVDIPSETSQLTITGTDSVKGEMIVCNRKGKTLYVFDVTLRLKWEGSAQVGEETIKGKGLIHVDDISNTEDKWKVIVKMEDENQKNRFLKEEMKNKSVEIIDKIVDGVLENMKSQASAQEQIGEGEVITPPKPVLVKSTGTATQTDSSSSQKKESSLRTKNLKQVISFDIAPNVLYDTLLDQQRVCAFTGGPAKVENRLDGEFILFDGAVQGKQVELGNGKKIVQKWRFNSWPENHFSQLTLDFGDKSGKTLLTLTQQGIPSSDFERTREGWENYFWRRISSLFSWEYKVIETS